MNWTTPYYGVSHAKAADGRQLTIADYHTFVKAVVFPRIGSPNYWASVREEIFDTVAEAKAWCEQQGASRQRRVAIGVLSRAPGRGEEMARLLDVKLGDVFIARRYGSFASSPARYSRETVVRETATQWVTNGDVRIRKRDGAVVGGVSLEPFDPDEWQRILDQRERRRLIRQLREAAYDGVSLETLRMVMAALAPELPKEAGR